MRIEIIRESRRIIRVRVPNHTVRAWCPGCAAEVEMVTLTPAGWLIDLAAGGQVHYSETPSGLLVCLNSLLRLSRAG